MINWKFPDPPNSAVVTTKQIMEQNQAILYVCHEADEDGESSWQFHPGETGFDFGDALLVGLDSVLEQDPSLLELADLPIGYDAVRENRHAPWVRREMT